MRCYVLQHTERGVSCNGKTGNHGRYDAVQLRGGPVFTDRPAGQPGNGGEQAGGEHHGLQTGREYPALRDVQCAGKPGLYRGHVSGPRGADPCAVHAGNYRTVGARRADSDDRQHACAERYEQVHVHMGRRHFNHQPRDSANRYPLKSDRGRLG